MPSSLSQSPRPSARRNGKVARLPKETRDKINRMLDDGFTYKAIIDALGDLGSGLNLQNVSNWRQGGYHEWVTSQELTARATAYTEHAVELVRGTGAVDAATIVQAGHVIGTSQLMEVLMDRGDGTLKKMLAENPDAFIRILNLVCRLANSSLQCEKHRDLAKAAGVPLKPAQTQSSPIKV